MSNNTRIKYKELDEIWGLNDKKEENNKNKSSLKKTLRPSNSVIRFNDMIKKVKVKEWKPEHRELYYVITADGQTFDIPNDKSLYDRRCFSFGNYFRTSKAAKYALKEIKKLLKSLPRG